MSIFNLFKGKEEEFYTIVTHVNMSFIKYMHSVSK